MNRILACLLLILAACSNEQSGSGTEPATAVVPGGNADRGKQHIEKYACLACHAIPGIEGPQGSLAPTLAGIASRPSISGRVPNSPDAMTAFLQNPQAVDPANQMPPLGISEAEARDITAFLFTLK